MWNGCTCATNKYMKKHQTAAACEMAQAVSLWLNLSQSLWPGSWRLCFLRLCQRHSLMCLREAAWLPVGWPKQAAEALSGSATGNKQWRLCSQWPVLWLTVPVSAGQWPLCWPLCLSAVSAQYLKASCLCYNISAWNVSMCNLCGLTNHYCGPSARGCGLREERREISCTYQTYLLR